MIVFHVVRIFVVAPFHATTYYHLHATSSHMTVLTPKRPKPSVFFIRRSKNFEHFFLYRSCPAESSPDPNCQRPDCSANVQLTFKCTTCKRTPNICIQDAILVTLGLVLVYFVAKKAYKMVCARLSRRCRRRTRY